jgi:glutathione peroxidase
MTCLYDFSATTIDGRTIDLGAYRDKVVLVVNTASRCGFTPQYEGLEALYRDYHARGFEVLCFPCNQFHNQEPGTSADIAAFCERHYSVSFQMFDKIDVNGPAAHPLYRWLKQAAPGFLGSKSIKWNFTKFLVDRKGDARRRFATVTPPARIAPAVSALL